MHYLRIAALAFFILSAALFAFTTFFYHKDEDTTPPVISSDSDVLEMSVNDPPEKLREGLTASDDRDGDITDKLIVSDESFFFEPGKCTVKYLVFDAAHNYASYSREIVYTDYEPTRFELEEPLVYMLGTNIDFMSEIHAIDALDGDISDRLRLVSSSLSNYEEGTYPVIVEVMNSHGEKSRVMLNVVVRKSESVWPQVKLSHYVVYLKQNEQFDPKSLIKQIIASNGAKVDRDKCDVKVGGMLDTSKPGNYTLIYKVGDAADTDGTYLTVVVTESEDSTDGES